MICFAISAYVLHSKFLICRECLYNLYLTPPIFFTTKPLLFVPSGDDWQQRQQKMDADVEMGTGDGAEGGLKVFLGNRFQGSRQNHEHR